MCCGDVRQPLTDAACTEDISGSVRLLQRTLFLAHWQKQHRLSHLFPASPADSAWGARWSDPERLEVGPRPFQASWFHLEGRGDVYGFTAQRADHGPHPRDTETKPTFKIFSWLLCGHVWTVLSYRAWTAPVSSRSISRDYFNKLHLSFTSCFPLTELSPNKPLFLVIRRL